MFILSSWLAHSPVPGEDLPYLPSHRSEKANVQSFLANSRLQYRAGEKNKNAIVPLLRTEHAPDRLPRTLLFNIIFHTFCNLFLSGQHILQQNSVTPNKSRLPISKPCLRQCSEFKMKQQQQSVFELQIQVKRDSLLQTIWLVGLHSRCAPTGRNTLTFYSNVLSVQIWPESESQRTKPIVLSCSILRGNLSLCWDVRTTENAVCW